MPTLRESIHAAVGEFSDTIQSLAMAKAVALSDLIEKHVGPTDVRTLVLGYEVGDPDGDTGHDVHAESVAQVSELIDNLREAESDLSDIDDALTDESDDTTLVAVRRLVREREEAKRAAGNAVFDIAKLKDERARLQSTLGMFASVIKSGEPWSLTCQNAYNEAMGRPKLTEDDCLDCGGTKAHWRWSIDRQEWTRDDPKPKPTASVSDGREWHDYSQGLRP